MKGFSKYFLLVWATGLGVMIIFAISTGHQDWESERESALNRVGQLSASLRLSLENLTEKTANELTRVIEVELVSQDLTHWLSESSFQSIAMVGKNNLGQWSVDWAKSKTPGDTNVKYQYQRWLPKLASTLGAIRGENLSWTHVEMNTTPPTKMLLLGVQLKVKAKEGETYKIAFGLLPLNYLTSLTAPLKSEGDEVFIVDRGGRALTFPNPTYLGNNLDVHEIVKSLKQSQKLSEYGSFKSLAGESTVGGYERSRNSNAYVVTNQKIRSQESAMIAVAESGIYGLSLIIFLSIITFFAGKKDSNRFRQMTKILRKSGADKAKDKHIKASSADIEKERRELFEQLGLTFLTQLRGPIYSSLGKIHKLSENIKDAEQKKDISFIETEVRRLRGFVEGLGQAFDLDSRPSERLDLSHVVESLLVNYKKLLIKREIMLEYEPHANAWLRINRDDLLYILNTIFDLAANKLTYTGEQKKIQLKIERMGGMNRLSILMVGAKFPVSEVESLFIIRDKENLELSFSRGFALSWNGNLSAESSILGARVFLELPAIENDIQEEVKAPQAPEEPLPTQVTQQKEESLNDKMVSAELDKVLPPTPAPSQKTEVSVVEDLTASTQASLNFSPEDDEPPKPPDEPVQVKIRKPKVRFDV